MFENVFLGADAMVQQANLPPAGLASDQLWPL